MLLGFPDKSRIAAVLTDKRCWVSQTNPELLLF